MTDPKSSLTDLRSKHTQTHRQDERISHPNLARPGVRWVIAADEVAQ